MQPSRSGAPKRLALTSSLAALLAGCAGGQGGFAPDIFEKSVAGMDGPLIETTNFAPGEPSVVGDQSPPRTFFFSGEADDPQANYFLVEANKAPIPAASRVIPDRRIREYLHGIAERLLAEAPPGAPEVQVHVLASNSYEAFAREGGDVYVSINALATAESEDEIAVLMGHELGHLLLKHHDKDRLFESQRDATSAAMLAAVTGLSLKAQIESSGQLSAAAQKNVQEDTVALAATKMAVDFVANDVVNASWNRTQENEADLIGFDLAVRAGYDPWAMNDSFGQLIDAAQERTTRVSGLSEKADERGAELEATMQASFEQGRFDIMPVFETGIAMLGDAGSALVADARDSLRSAYQSPEGRLERAEEYLDRFYPEPDVEPSTDYKRTRERLRFKQMNNAYEKVADALDAVTEKRFEDAIGHLNQGYRTGLIGDHPVPRMVEAHARRGLGDSARALSALERVSSRTPLPVEGYILKADIQAARGAGRSALATLDRGESFYGVEAMQPARVKVLARLERQDAMEVALADCEKMSRRTQRACDAAVPETVVASADPDSPGLLDQMRDRIGNPLGDAAGEDGGPPAGASALRDSDEGEGNPFGNVLGGIRDALEDVGDAAKDVF